MNLCLWIVQALLAAAFGMAGVMKAFQYQQAKAKLPWVKDVPKGLVHVIGASELAGALGLVLPLAIGVLPQLTAWAGVGLAVVMVLAAGFHAKRGEFGGIAFNAVLGGLAAFVAWGRF
jgi:uncharacterized membrane protein